MRNGNDRPICHRAEDLVTYLYREATAEEARDFTAHMQQCDACRAEFKVFNQIHDSIVTWRNEALGPIAAPTSAREISFVTPEIVQHGRRLPALAALREFFSVSPLWLRGVTAFAGLLLCALLIFAAARMWRQPTVNSGSEANYGTKEFDEAVEKKVAEQIAKLNQTAASQNSNKETSGATEQPPPAATGRNRLRSQPRTRLTREERVQLAADLGLIQVREEEMPFVLADEPNR